ncbi:FecR domain-containing protein [Oryzibacter oryziterrae]|uniref:FecR domain-containing protein n=1 Tax=Oryzibacter oryziterrae TaxID=2766474 RepID=UPI001F261041|nr:FecR domain-containing protein [Oryzibacter oryziterrae]
MQDFDAGRLDRRRFALLLAAAAMATPSIGLAEEGLRSVGDVRKASGGVFAESGALRPLQAGSDILLGDLVWTDVASRAALALEGGSDIFLGAKTRLKIDRFVAATGGRLILGDGALVFDRDDSLPKTDIKLLSAFGQIGVRGTRFFAGPSKGVFAVFCERGEVHVAAAGARRVLKAGDGVDFPVKGGKPSAVQKWGAARVEKAFASVLG